jgi:glycosyltransferase involved in cell wall biosynthesis
VSIVVATHNRSVRLEALLRALRTQNIGRNALEVIVVDDASDDSTQLVLQGELTRGDLDLTILRNETTQGPAQARDRGWRAARSDVIAFTDDDCEPDPDWLTSGLQSLRASPGTFVQGRTEPIPAERGRIGPFTRTIEVREQDAGFQTCNIFYPRALLQKVDGFDTAVFGRAPGGEDADLGWRVLAAGARAKFEPEALVYHAVNELGPVGKLRVAGRWTTPMRAYVRHPELRRAHFVKGLFWKGSHYLLARAALAVLLPARLRWLGPWLGLPYLQEIEHRRQHDRAGPWILPYYLIHDIVECWAIVRAAVRYRHPMI